MSENPVSVLRWSDPNDILPVKHKHTDVLAVHKGYPEAIIAVKATLVLSRPYDFLWWAPYPAAPVRRGPVRDRRKQALKDRRGA
jgi:hypothetical protein